MFVDDVKKGDIFCCNFFGVFIFVKVNDVYYDHSVDIYELGTVHWKKSNSMFDIYKKYYPDLVISKTGYVEIIKYPFRMKNKKERMLYQSINRVPYGMNKKNELCIGLPISDMSLAYMKALAINKDKKIKPGIYSAKRVYSSLNNTKEDLDKLTQMYFPYYAVPRKEIEKYRPKSFIEKKVLS